MNIYVIISILLLLLFIIEQKSKRKIRNFLFYIAAILVVGLLAFRSANVGSDTPHYCGYFTGEGGMYRTFHTNDFFEPGFQLFVWILLQISQTEFWFLLSSSLFTMIPFLYLIYKNNNSSKILPFLLYMTMWGIIYITQTAIRQDIAVSLFLLAYIFFIQKNINRNIKYALCTTCALFAFFTHTSSLLSFPLFMLAMIIPLTKKRALILMASSLVFSLVFKDIVEFIFNSLYSLLNKLDMASHMLDVYYNNQQYALNEEISINRLLPPTLLVCTLIWMSKKEDFNSHYLKSLFLGAFIYNIGASFPMIHRSVFLLLFFGIIYTPYKLSLRTFDSKFLILILLFMIYKQISYMNSFYEFIWE